MSKLNGLGPNNEGRDAGRGLGLCKTKGNEAHTFYPLGVGMGKRRQAGQNPNKRTNK